MAQKVGREAQFEDELQRLADGAAELGITVGEIFKNAAAALFEPGREAGQSAVREERSIRQMVTTYRQESLAALRRYSPAGDQLRRVVELQQFAGEFGAIAERAASIAQHALALSGGADRSLARVSYDAPEFMRQIIYQAYVEMRGCLIVCAARDTEKARRVILENAELHRYYQALKRQLDQAIQAEPREALPLHRLLLVATRLAEIGDRAVAICNTVLVTAPQTIHES
ncbi:MAG TPA: PhoU domain-containing protein [Ktedonobacterales bacterium]|nr:PhoU domain-containing protein [Ktedonobacterales bacterium]